MIHPSPQVYLESLGLELESQMNRVRALIGESHWITDGHHKEYLLAGVLERFLPTGFTACRGFVVRDQSARDLSKEQDLLVIDTRSQRPLFLQHGIAVTFLEQVVAAISVKTKMAPEELNNAVVGLE